MTLRCLMIALALLAVVASDSWGQSKNPPSSQPKTAQQERGTDNSPVVVKVLPTEKTKPELDTDKEKQESDRQLVKLTGDLAKYTEFLFGATAILALVTGGLVIVGFLQVRDAKKSIAAAVKSANAAVASADAARINAQALIDAESAQIYVVILTGNIGRLYELGGTYDNSPTMHANRFDPPFVEYRLRNYGKSPAILQSVLHGLSLEEPNAAGHGRTYQAGRDAMEIVGVGEQSLSIVCTYDLQFTFGDVQSIVTHNKLLFFFGRAEFMDHFGRKQILEWEFFADEAQWKLISHRNTRENPDGRS